MEQLRRLRRANLLAVRLPVFHLDGDQADLALPDACRERLAQPVVALSAIASPGLLAL